MSDIIKINIDKKIYDVNIINDNNKLLYKASDIGKILELSNFRTSILNFNSNLKILYKTKTNGGYQNIIYLTMDGIKALTSKSRCINAPKLAKAFEMDIMNIYSYSKECNTIENIITCFKNENIKTQYFVNNYRIDLYFPDYKLAIECDEYFHKNKKIKDIDRQKIIENELDCVFIRYNPDEKNFNIFIVINAIYEHIKNHKF